MVRNLFSRGHVALVNNWTPDDTFRWRPEVALLLMLPALLRAQGPEVVLATQLDDKALILELPTRGGSNRVRELQGIGDLSGDGFADVALVVDDLRGPSADAIVIYGRTGATGRYPLEAVAGDLGVVTK